MLAVQGRRGRGDLRRIKATDPGRAHWVRQLTQE
jgi:hypothetical protein